MSDMSEQISAEHGWQFGRIIDPVRAAALHEAVALCQLNDDLTVPDILSVAERFERWLVGADEATP
jgi:hypothetical protein